MYSNRDSAVSVPFQMFDGNGTLQFDMVRREDTGRYFCTAYNGYGSVSSDYTHLLVSGEWQLIPQWCVPMTSASLPL